MNRRWPHLFVCLAILAGLLVSAPASLSQQATPVASTEGLSLAASGLDNPRGFAWGPDGTMYVAEASTSLATGGATPIATPGAIVAGLDGDIVKIDSACPVVYQGNLPSSEGFGGSDLGPASVEFVNGQLYLLDEGGGASHGNELTPDGIYLIPGDGSARVVADLGAWIATNPVANQSMNPDADGDLTSMTVANGTFFVVESNGGQILQVTTDGEITRFADLSASDAAPSGIALASDGRVLVGLGDSIVSIAADGSTSDAWTGLTSVVDVTVGPNNTLFAVQGDGTVIRQTGPDTATTVASGFTDPSSLAFGPDGGLYVSSPASGAPLMGSVVRISTDFGQPLKMSDELLVGNPCLPTPTATATTAPTDTSDAATPDDGAATPEPDSGTDSTVTIDNYAFSEDSIAVEAGTTVTWVNNDVAAHTVTASDGSFDSGNLAPGESWSYTFEESGSFEYSCTYHPNMVAKVVVN